MNIANSTMPIVSTMDLRGNLGAIFDQVMYTGQGVVVERKGKELVAIVPVKMVREMERFSREKKLKALKNISRILRSAKGGSDPNMTDEKAMEIANAAVQEVRQMRANKFKKK